MTAPGTVYGVGVGPGDPELITLKGYRVLQRAAVVAFPAPLEGDSLARGIAAPHLRADVQGIAIRMPMTASRFPAQQVYDRAAEEIGAHVRQGADVAVLCEGDPFFYGSFMYLFARLAEAHAVEVIPGVSSLTAAPAVCGLPLASRNDVLAVIPAPLEEAVLAERLGQAEAAVVIKIGRHLPKLRRALAATGLLDNARYIEHATMTTQFDAALTDLPDDHAAPYFSMVLVHRRGEAWRQ